MIVLSGGKMKKRLYYARCMSEYNSVEDLIDLEMIRKAFPDHEIYNPADDSSANEGYKLYGMNYFLSIVGKSDVVVFRPTNSGITAGVFKEIDYARNNGIPVFEIPRVVHGRRMSVEQTREYLVDCGYKNREQLNKAKKKVINQQEDLCKKLF